MRAERLATPSLLVAALLFFWPGAAHAGDPDLVWFTLETPHFVITYHSGEERLARRVAVVAEDAHVKLAPLLDHVPAHRTQLLLTDTTDDANGSATAVPYDAVRLNATAPDDRSELNDYDDWLSALILHEYTHILHLDTVHGIARVLNWILGFGENGLVYAPNQAQPRFVIEGLAVFEETERTAAGRLRSTIYDMWLRTAALEHRLQRLDQFTNTPIQWPRGSSPYLYGSAFLRFIANKYGPDVLRKMSHDYGGNWLPGAMNRSLWRATGGKQGGQTFETLYPEFRDSLESRYRAQLAEIDSAGRVEGTPVTGARELCVRPTFTPDGKEVIWADSDMVSRQQFRRVFVGGAGSAEQDGKPRTFYKVDSPGGGVLSRDGKRFYFQAEEVYKTVYLFNDLFELDVARGTKRQLTYGLRAAEPDLSPDGTTLVFDINEHGARSLATMLAAGGPITRLLDGQEDFSQVYTPVWSPDGKTIAFSMWRPGGYRDIWLMDVATRELTRITADRALDLEPRYSPDGKYLYFSSDRTGVYNLYAYEFATSQLRQITNLAGGAFDVTISPDGKRAVYVGFVADGYRLERIDLEPTKWKIAPSPIQERPETPDVPKGFSQARISPYAAWRTAWPHTFFPSLYADTFGYVLGFSLGGTDIAGHHSYALSMGFSLARADAVSVDASYQYSRLWPTFSLTASRHLSARNVTANTVAYSPIVGGSQYSYSYLQDSFSASAAVSLPILRSLASSSDLTLNYNFAYLRVSELAVDAIRPGELLPDSMRLSSLGVTWSYSNVQRFTYSISPALGRSLIIQLGGSFKGIGSTYNEFSAAWRWREYIPFFFQDHVLYFTYSGGVSLGDATQRAFFSIGGYGAQPDPLLAIFDAARPGGGNLRGYGFGSILGNEYQVATLEYRFPIAWIERGYATLPIYFKRLHGAVFVDAGNAWSGRFDYAQLKAGAGAELRLETLLGWYLPVALQLGYARGFMEGGGNQVYFYVNNPF